MNWPYSSATVHELVQAPKCFAPGQSTAFANVGEHGKELSAMLELVDGGLYHLKLIVSAGRADLPESYEASFLLNNRRVRGLGFSKIERKRKYKTHIPKGWHENIIDWNLPASDDNHNRHPSIPDFAVTHLQDFLKKACLRWKIEIEYSDDLW